MTHTDTPTSPQSKLQRLNSLEWRLLAPVPVIVVIATILVWVVVPRVVDANATNEAIRAGQQIAAQLKKIRAYYTENIVNKALKTGALKTAVDHTRTRSGRWPRRSLCTAYPAKIPSS